MSSHISNGHPYEVYRDRQSRDQTLYCSRFTSKTSISYILGLSANIYPLKIRLTAHKSY
jgi:hypothetical protein